MTEKKNKFSFSKENAKKAEEIVSKYPTGRQKSAVLPLLDLAQRQNNGWLSVDVIEHVADYILEPYMRVYEVASFYSMFYLKPVGKNHIQVCGTTPCWLRGAADILKTCEDQIGIKCGRWNFPVCSNQRLEVYGKGGILTRIGPIYQNKL